MQQIRIQRRTSRRVVHVEPEELQPTRRVDTSAADEVLAAIDELVD